VTLTTRTGDFRLSRYTALLQAGGVIAYPTEAVFGLGCDPDDPDAVARILDLKGRSPNKGLILIAADREQLEPYIQPLTPELEARIDATWPGPVTWILPATERVSDLISGGSATVAVRVTDHPLAAGLCRAFGGPLVSTSANRSGGRPARTALRARLLFGAGVDAVVSGKVGGLARPTRIIDGLTGATLRE
jgi:L-threonylcarbamoyladenylate synthase